MRFVSWSAGLRVPVRPEKRVLLDTGDWDYRVTNLTAEFRPLIAKQHEIEAALRQFKFKVDLVDEDTREPIPGAKEQNVGVFDSEEAQRANDWSDAEREMVEKKLLEGEFHGYDWLYVAPQETPLPYASYKKHRAITGKRTIEKAIADITTAVEAAGIDPAAVVAYERDNKDKHSDAIIAAMEALSSVEPDPEDELIAA